MTNLPAGIRIIERYKRSGCHVIFMRIKNQPAGLTLKVYGRYTTKEIDSIIENFIDKIIREANSTPIRCVTVFQI